jgi:hypothetical protein
VKSKEIAVTPVDQVVTTITTSREPIAMEYEPPTKIPQPIPPKKDDAKNFLKEAKESLSRQNFVQFRENLRLFRTKKMTPDQLIDSVLVLFVGSQREILLQGTNLWLLLVTF